MSIGATQSEKKQTCQEARRQIAATAANDSRPSNAQNRSTLSYPAKAYLSSSSTPRKKLDDESKEIARHTSADKNLETFQSRDLTTYEWTNQPIKYLREVYKNPQKAY